MLTTAAFACSAYGRDLAAIRQSGQMIVSTEGGYPPFNFFQGGKLTGYEVEVAEAIAAKLGVRIEWKVLAFDAQIPAIAQDRFDAAIASHAITAERAKSVDFTRPHYCSGGQIVSLANGPSTARDLAGKVIVVQIGTTYLEAARKVPGVKSVSTLPKDTDAEQALLAGRADAWITDKFAAKTAAEKNPGARLKRGELLFSERVAMILKKGNTSLKSAIDGALAELNRDGTLARLSQKYFGEDVRCPE
jgi:polar amino acid transport system substrate-binding protein